MDKNGDNIKNKMIGDGKATNEVPMNCGRSRKII